MPEDKITILYLGESQPSSRESVQREKEKNVHKYKVIKRYWLISKHSINNQKVSKEFAKWNLPNKEPVHWVQMKMTEKGNLSNFNANWWTKNEKVKKREQKV